MFQNYLIVALRSLRKNRLYSFLNIAGLGIGLAAALLIALYVAHELSYDRLESQCRAHRPSGRRHQFCRHR